jgi:hypothetical protein
MSPFFRCTIPVPNLIQSLFGFITFYIYTIVENWSQNNDYDH